MRSDPLRPTWLPVVLTLLICPAWPVAAAPDEELNALRAEVARLTARLDALEAHSRVRVDELAAPASPVAPADPGLEWARRVAVKGDLRYRYEEIDEQGDPDRPRHRLRARFGAAAALADNLDVHLQFATGAPDPRSTNQSLGGNFSTKEIGMNLGYFDWEALPGLHTFGGKMRHPVRRIGDSRFIDPDINPEGVAFTWMPGSLFVTGYGFVAVERAADDDTWVLGGQAGYSGEMGGDMTLTTGISYANWSEAEGRTPFFDGLPNGNSLDVDGTLLYDFDLVDVFAELAFGLFDQPVSVYGQYGVNTQADDDDTAYSVGFLVGKADAPRKWEFGYSYNDHERDALFAQVVDSDFGGGDTGANGHILRGGLGIAKNVTVNLTYFMNEVEADLASRHDYDRLQLDFNFKY